MMRKRIKRIGNAIIGILFFWTVLTIYVQYAGKNIIKIIGNKNAPKKALIVFKADPIYNLDEQVCENFALGLSNYGFISTVTTVKKASKINAPYDLYVFCANTYNWSPDWQITNYIQDHPNITNKNCVAITLGSGATARSKRLLEQTIIDKNANLVDSRTYWLLKPNDENRMEEKNTDVANSMSKTFGEAIGKRYFENSSKKEY